MPRGISQDLIDHPAFGICWCGTRFQKKAENQFHCCPSHRRIASILRKHNPPIPPPHPNQKKTLPPSSPPRPPAPSSDFYTLKKDAPERDFGID